MKPILILVLIPVFYSCLVSLYIFQFLIDGLEPTWMDTSLYTTIGFSFTAMTISWIIEVRTSHIRKNHQLKLVHQISQPTTTLSLSMEQLEAFIPSKVHASRVLKRSKIALESILQCIQALKSSV